MVPVSDRQRQHPAFLPPAAGAGDAPRDRSGDIRRAERSRCRGRRPSAELLPRRHGGAAQPVHAAAPRRCRAAASHAAIARRHRRPGGARAGRRAGATRRSRHRLRLARRPIPGGGERPPVRLRRSRTAADRRAGGPGGRHDSALAPPAHVAQARALSATPGHAHGRGHRGVGARARHVGGHRRAGGQGARGAQRRRRRRPRPPARGRRSAAARLLRRHHLRSEPRGRRLVPEPGDAARAGRAARRPALGDRRHRRPAARSAAAPRLRALHGPPARRARGGRRRRGGGRAAAHRRRHAAEGARGAGPRHAGGLDRQGRRRAGRGRRRARARRRRSGDVRRARPARRRRRGAGDAALDGGRSLVAGTYTWDAIGARLLAVVERAAEDPAP